MASVSLKLPAPLLAKVEALARQRRTTKSAVLREALETYLANGAGRPKVSAYDLAKHLCGVLEGKRDSATNPKYMEGFGE